MEANELMLGDWVQVDNPSFDINNRIGYIIGIESKEGHVHPSTFNICFKEDDGGICHYVGCRKYNVKPIPLTREILEKNGFVDWSDHSRTTRSCSMLLDKNTSICVQVTDGNDSIFLQIHRCGAGSFEHRMNIKYVHQLQQLFRLCGIDKEITLA